MARVTYGVKWSDLEFSDDIRAIAKEQNRLAKLDRLARKRFEELGRIITADFERERQQQLAEALRKQAQYRLEFKLAELDEKMQSAIEADRAEARRVFSAYAARVAKAFHVAVEADAKERLWGNKQLKRIERDMERSKLHVERVKLLERGVVRGRRR
jgi:hypothetical protein